MVHQVTSSDRYDSKLLVDDLTLVSCTNRNVVVFDVGFVNLLAINGCSLVHVMASDLRVAYVPFDWFFSFDPSSVYDIDSCVDTFISSDCVVSENFNKVYWVLSIVIISVVLRGTSLDNDANDRPNRVYAVVYMLAVQPWLKGKIDEDEKRVVNFYIRLVRDGEVVSKISDMVMVSIKP